MSPLALSKSWCDLLPEHPEQAGPYLSSHSQAPPAASRFLLATTSRGTPARTVQQWGRTVGCQGYRSACFLQTAAGETGCSALLMESPLLHHPFLPFPPPLLLATLPSQPEGSVTVDSWSLRIMIPGCSVLRPRLLFLGKVVRDPEHRRQGADVSGDCQVLSSALGLKPRAQKKH